MFFKIKILVGNIIFFLDLKLGVLPCFVLVVIFGSGQTQRNMTKHPSSAGTTSSPGPDFELRIVEGRTAGVGSLGKWGAEPRKYCSPIIYDSIWLISCLTEFRCYKILVHSTNISVCVKSKSIHVYHSGVISLT